MLSWVIVPLLTTREAGAWNCMSEPESAVTVTGTVPLTEWPPEDS